MDMFWHYLSVLFRMFTYTAWTLRKSLQWVWILVLHTKKMWSIVNWSIVKLLWLKYIYFTLWVLLNYAGPLCVCVQVLESSVSSCIYGINTSNREIRVRHINHKIHFVFGDTLGCLEHMPWASLKLAQLHKEMRRHSEKMCGPNYVKEIQHWCLLPLPNGMQYFQFE